MEGGASPRFPTIFEEAKHEDDDGDHDGGVDIDIRATTSTMHMRNKYL